jgi:hypothetical protein
VGETLENQFTVVTRGVADTVVIGATPASVSTSVQVTGTESEVVLQANSGFVSISGIETSSLPTTVVLGDFFQSIGDITQNIQADVSVSNVGTLSVANFGNESTNENVTVTQANISGTGLFGNNSVDVSYGNVGTVNLNSGQRQDEYTFETSSPSAKFTSKINLFDNSSVFLGAHVDLDANSHLNLSLFNETSKAGELFISAPGGKFSNQPQGIIDVSFNGVLSSQIDNQGFTVEEEHN